MRWRLYNDTEVEGVQSRSQEVVAGAHRDASTSLERVLVLVAPVLW